MAAGPGPFGLRLLAHSLGTLGTNAMPQPIPVPTGKVLSFLPFQLFGQFGHFGHLTRGLGAMAASFRP